MLYFRALDWDSNAPLNKYPLIAIYKSSEQGSIPYANIGYAGLIGVLTGVNAEGVAIAAKVWVPRKGSETLKPKATYFGKPWAYVLKDLL